MNPLFTCKPDGTWCWARDGHPVSKSDKVYFQLDTDEAQAPEPPAYSIPVFIDEDGRWPDSVPTALPQVPRTKLDNQWRTRITYSEMGADGLRYGKALPHSA